MTHLSPEILSATLDGALEDAARQQAERHLAECAECRAALAALAAQDAELRPALEHDPGEAYFETFAARVEDRIRAAGLRGAQSRLATGGWLGWLTSPRRLAWVGAAAAVVVGAGIVMMTSRSTQPLLQSREVLERSKQRDESALPPFEQKAQVPAPATREQDGKEGAKKLEAEGFAQKNAAKDDNRVSDRDALSRQEEMTSGSPETSAQEPKVASPQRATEVRRSAAGEDVPVRHDAMHFAEPPAAGAVGDLKSAKPRAAQPADQQPSASNVAPLSTERDRAAGPQLCGRVVDTRQQPVPGATVAVADLGAVATAGVDGRFCVSAPTGLHELSVMAVGYEPTRLQVRVEGESSQALVTLRAVSVLGQSGGLALGGGRSGEAKLSLEPFAKFKSGPAAPLAESAARLSARAESLHSAIVFDSAGVAWARVGGAAKGAEWLEAHYRAAEARFRAWQLAPTATRARVARDALDSFLASAPAGPRRDQVAAWRRQIGP